jgi:hypothetical protein
MRTQLQRGRWGKGDKQGIKSTLKTIREAKVKN